jgi:hypothetical protein
MIDKLNFLTGRTDNRPIFIIGTGRSGTHWIGNTLANHPEISATIETQPIFGLSTRIALNPNREWLLYFLLVWIYRVKMFQAAPRRYLDKSHPNIWIAERLKTSFPQARFIGIERNPYATVASMLKRKAVLNWHRRWTDLRVPNRFLGITAENARTYEQMPIAARCALRWVNHRHKMNSICNSLRDAVLVISYEKLACDTESAVKDLEQFLGLRVSIPLPDVDKSALTKWKTQLSKEEIHQIETVVGLSPDTVECGTA